MDFLLHAGAGHPDVLWLGLTALVSFLAGSGIGAYAMQQRQQPTHQATPTEE
ncbi:hypothetical protein ACNS7O_02425 [Haloferacaceae archaeon DSL9]